MTTLHYASTKNSDMLYAARVEITDAFFYLDVDAAVSESRKRYVFLDSREYGVFLEHNHQEDLECVLLEDVMKKAGELGGTRKGVHALALTILEMYDTPGNKELRVSNSMPVDMADMLREEGFKLEIASALFPERVVKQTWESAAIRESLQRTHVAFQMIEKVLGESEIVGDEIMYEGVALTSEALKQKVEVAMLEKDLLNIEGLIISCGEKGNQAAIPHHLGSGVLRPHQTIVCDIFPRHRATGYYADMTRTYVKGTPSDEVRKMYMAVQEAQKRGIAAARAGVTGAEVHKICADYFIEQGFETQAPNGFVHGTGHGLGLDVHEPPSVSVGGVTPLRAGNVVTIEPGLYYKDIGGVRLEDVVLITENGAENLTQYPTDQWIIA